MDPNALLAQLRDVQAPEAISAWPPAFGWWILAFLALTLITLSIIKLIQWRKKTAWRRMALNEFKTLKQHYMKAPSESNFVQLVALIKRAAASSQSNPALLTYTGDKWAELLSTPSNALIPDDIEKLKNGHYQQECPELDNKALQRIEQWIKRQSV